MSNNPNDTPKTTEPPYDTSKKLAAAPRKEVEDNIDRQLKAFKTNPTGDKPIFLVQAQFLMQELVRRDQDEQVRTMLKYTKQVTVMTVVIMIMTLLQTGIEVMHLMHQ